MQAQRTALRVFVAEDSVPIQERVRDMLAAADMKVVGGAASTDRCIAEILASAPDVVVLDIQLEGGSGLDVMRAVRRSAPEVAFVVFSNNSAPAYRKRYMAEGADDFLDKSTEFDRLTAAVAHASRQHLH